MNLIPLGIATDLMHPSGKGVVHATGGVCLRGSRWTKVDEISGWRTPTEVSGGMM